MMLNFVIDLLSQYVRYFAGYIPLLIGLGILSAIPYLVYAIANKR